MAALYKGVRALAGKVSTSLVLFHSIPLKGDILREIEEDAAADFIAKYLEDPGFKIEVSFYSYMRRILQVAFFRPARGNRRIDNNAVGLDELYTVGTYYDEETIERIQSERLIDQIVGELTASLSAEEVRGVFPHIIQIIERPGRRDYKTYLYRIKDERIRGLVDEAMLTIREGITGNV